MCARGRPHGTAPSSSQAPYPSLPPDGERSLIPLLRLSPRDPVRSRWRLCRPTDAAYPLRLLRPERWVAVRTLHSAKKQKAFFYSIEQNIFQPRTHRAHCAATAKTEVQRSNPAAVHLCTSKQSTHSRKTRSVLHSSRAPPQREARPIENQRNDWVLSCTMF